MSIGPFSPHAIPQASQSHVDDVGRVCVDLACLHCGYNLRGLTFAGPCSECGQPCDGTVLGGHLQLAEAGWVKTMANGALFTLLSVIGWICVPLVVYAAPFLGLRTKESATTLAFLISLITLILGLIGVMQVTQREPARRDRPNGCSARRAARVLSVAFAIVVLWTWVWAAFELFEDVDGFVSTVLLTLPVQLAPLFLGLALARHLRSILRRVPQHRLARHATVQFWAALVAGGLFIITQLAYFYWLFAVLLPSFSALGTTTAPAGPSSAPSVVVSGDDAVETDPDDPVLFSVRASPISGITTQSAAVPAPAAPPGFAGRWIFLINTAMFTAGVVLLGIVIRGVFLLGRCKHVLSDCARRAGALRG